MSVRLDYDKVFNRLCHMLVLKKSRNLHLILDDLVATTIHISRQPITTDAQVCEALRAFTGVSISEQEVSDSLHRLQQGGRVLPGRPSSPIILDLGAAAQIETRIRDAQILEDTVRQEWLSSIKESFSGSPTDWEAKMWNSLQAFMANAFKQHGAETIMLLSPDSEEPRGVRKQLSTYLREAVHQHCGDLPQELASDAIRSFFSESNLSRTKYVAQLLDGTFAYFSLASDETTSAYLRSTVAPLSLFLDTNFIFGILDLHSNQFDDASRELVKAIQQYSFPFKLYYHVETLNELRDAVDHYGGRLRGRTWSQEISKAALVVGQELSGIELEYHRKNVQRPISPDVYLSRFDNLAVLLTAEHGFRMYNTANETEPRQKERHLLVAEYKHFLENTPKSQKRYEAMNHDVMVWLTVRDLRKPSQSPLDAGAFFLTADYYFYRFDWEVMRKDAQLGLVVLPSQFLQILRPFMDGSPDFDQRFVETFALPEFRTLRSFGPVTSKVMDYLNSYSDISAPTAIRILTNTVLKQELCEVQDDEEQFRRVLEDGLLRDNQQLLEEKIEADKIAQRASSDAIDTERRLLAEREALHTSELRMKQVEAQIDELVTTRQREHAKAQAIEIRASELEEKSQRILIESTQIRELKDRAERDLRRTRGILAVLVAILGIGMILVLPRLFQWQWLDQHPDRLGVYLSAITIVLCVAIAIGSPKARKGALILGLAIGAFSVLLQIVGR